MAALKGKPWSQRESARRLAPPWPMISIRSTTRSAAPPQSFTFSACSRSVRSTRPAIERANAAMNLEEELAISLTVNGERVTRSVPVRQHLVDFLRIDLGLTGSHIGCEHGVCGACSVRVDGAVVRGCLMLAVQADGCRRGHDRGPDRIRGDRRPAGEIRRAQRAAVRLLHAGHADHRRRAAQAGQARDP